MIERRQESVCVCVYVVKPPCLLAGWVLSACLYAHAAHTIHPSTIELQSGTVKRGRKKVGRLGFGRRWSRVVGASRGNGGFFGGTGCGFGYVDDERAKL